MRQPLSQRTTATTQGTADARDGRHPDVMQRRIPAWSARFLALWWLPMQITRGAGAGIGLATVAMDTRIFPGYSMYRAAMRGTEGSTSRVM